MCVYVYIVHITSHSNEIITMLTISLFDLMCTLTIYIMYLIT